MGISGLVAAGAQDGLDEAVVQMLAERKFKEQLRAQQAQEMVQQAQLANAQARLAQDASQHQDSLGIQNRQLEESAANRRQRANEAGVEDMLRQAALQQPKPVKLTRVTTTGPKGEPVSKGFTDEELAGGVPEYREPDKPPTPKDDRQWLLRDGKPVYSNPMAGDTPYDRTRTGERPVLSSDANNIADIDNSLSLLDGLKDAIGKTGASSQMGAIAPNFVTELTGLGEDAKQRQALIDSAKQIIGKALEGGVLRKEDEAKYARILPTIGDPPAVAQQKIDGLKQALVQKREVTLEALGAAGYGVGRFRSQGSVPKPAVSHGPSGGAERKPIPGVPGGVAEFRDGKWIRVQ